MHKRRPGNRSVIGAGLALTLALAGCGGGSGSSSTSAKNSGTGSQTLKVWDYASGFGGSKESEQAFFAMEDEINRRFEAANPKVKVEQTHFGYTGYQTKLQAAYAAHNAPDVAWEYVDLLWKITESLDDLLSASDKSGITLLNQAVQTAKDGKIHNMPWGTYEGVWMYNKKIFQQAGLQPPQTQAEFLDACDKLNARGVVPIRVTFGGEYSMNRYVALFAGQLIQNIADWNHQKIDYTSPEYRAGVQAFMDMTAHKCWGPNPASKSVPGESDQAFRSGKTAVLYATQQINVDDYEKNIGKDQLGVFLQPALAGGRPNMDASQNNGFMIMKGTKNKDLAWKYISFYEAAAQQELAWQRIQQLPNRTDVHVSATQPVYTQMSQWASDPQFHVGAWPIGTQEFAVYNRATPEVVSGRTSVDDLLKQLQAARAKSRG